MNIEEKTNEEYHLNLVSSYIISNFIYSMSFRKRVNYDTGFVRYCIDTYDENLDALSDKKLEDMINSLKTPWWNKLYEIFLEDHTSILAIVWLLLNPKVILRIFKSKDLLQ